MKMKRSLTMVLATMATIALCATLAEAGTATPRVDRRQVRQQARITQGVHSGALTRCERARLEAGQAHVRRVEARAKADGIVTPRERAHLRHAQNVQSRHIYRAKHNVRTR
jgi:hypothetical protein